MNKPHGVTRAGNKINTKTHFQYIAREGQYARIKGRTEDLVFTESGNMPEWADSAADFWDAAENHRRANGRAYREFILGLQEELSIEDNVACIHKLMEVTGIKDKHAYTFAVHDKVAHFDSEHRNIHCHLMFSELEIEKDRPLDETKYFSRYSKTESGQLTGGYKANRYFQDRNGTIEMRKKWAAIVNAKFKERGLDCRIDERTLEAQKEELIAKGITDNIKYFCRAVPEHLGGAYRNKKATAQINKAILHFKSNFDVLKDADIESIKDKKIMRFAVDYNMRLVAKEIQNQRYKTLIDNNSIREKIEDLDPEQPFAVSVNNLRDELKMRAWEQQHLIDRYTKEAKAIKSKIVYEKSVQSTATDRVLNGKYKPVILEYYKLSEAEKPLWKEYHKLQEQYGIKPEYKSKMDDWQKRLDEAKAKHQKTEALWDEREEIIKNYGAKPELEKLLDEWHKKFDEPHRRKQELGNQIKLFKEIMATPEFIAKRDAEIANIKTVNAEELPKLKEISRKLFIAEKKFETADKAYRELSEVDGNEILFRSKIPPLVSAKSRIYGTEKCEDLPCKMVEDQKYFVFQTVNANSALAIKFNDLTLQGKAKVYEIKTVIDKDNTSKISVVPTNTSVALYKEKNKVPQAEHGGHSLSAGSGQSPIINKIMALADKAEEKGAMKMHAEAKKELPVDEVSKVEKEIYENWEKGMRFQGRMN